MRHGQDAHSLWIAEVLVPSLSLVQQNLAEWGRRSAEDFDTLVVCSDDSVLQSQADTTIQSTADLGVKVTTDPAEIRHFLNQRRKRPAVVFATYLSSDWIATAQADKSTGTKEWQEWQEPCWCVKRLIQFSVPLLPSPRNPIVRPIL